MQINRCPKCGRKPIEIRCATISRKVIGFKFICDFCFTTPGMYKTRPKAVAKWNEMTEERTNETTKA